MRAKEKSLIYECSPKRDVIHLCNERKNLLKLILGRGSIILPENLPDELTERIEVLLPEVTEVFRQNGGIRSETDQKLIATALACSEAELIAKKQIVWVYRNGKFLRTFPIKGGQRVHILTRYKPLQETYFAMRNELILQRRYASA
jgi:hypothetical protein